MKSEKQYQHKRQSTRNTGTHCEDIRELRYGKQIIRTVSDEGNVYLSAADVARAINMSNGRITRLYLPKNQSTIFNLPTPGGVQPVRMVNLRGIVCILARSKKPESASLMEWLFNKFYIAETTNIPEDAWTSLSIG